MGRAEDLGRVNNKMLVKACMQLAIRLFASMITPRAPVVVYWGALHGSWRLAVSPSPSLATVGGCEAKEQPNLTYIQFSRKKTYAPI